MELPNEKASQTELPQWQKDLIDSRLEAIAQTPGCLHPIEELYQILASDIED
ncbi:MAG: hypothetical protein V4722_22705 [Bacteroidota bacterium]